MSAPRPKCPAEAPAADRRGSGGERSSTAPFLVPRRPWRGRIVPGALSWATVILSVIGTLSFPRIWVWVSAALILYFVVRLAIHLVFYLVGELRCRRWEACDWTRDERLRGPCGIAPMDVWHVVIVPAFSEPLEVLTRTLDALAAQHRASERLVVVLGMEQAEDGGIEKGRKLAQQYASSFRRIAATEHPRRLEGEVAGKASNQTWAAQEARVLLDDLGVDIAHATITSCDADSRLHPRYLAAVARLFADSPDPWGRFWQAPLFFDNNIWEVPAPVRFSTWFMHAEHLSELAMPFYEPLPLSTYTLAMQTAEACGWWDPLVISEDWHTYLACLFARDGDLELEPVFLPAHGDATGGDSFMSGLLNRFHQLVRHAWGAEDVGFILAALAERGALKRGRGLFRLAQVTHDHVMRVSTWFIFTSGYLLSVRGRSQLAVADTLVRPLPSGPDLSALFMVGAVAIFGIILVDLNRCPPPKSRRTRVPFEIALMWLGLPLIGFGLGMLPAIYAQTRLMFGRTLAYRSTPKRASTQTAQGAARARR